MQNPSKSWLRKDWRLCPGNIHGEDVHGSVAALCVCIEYTESWKIPLIRAQSRPLASLCRSALKRKHTQSGDVEEVYTRSTLTTSRQVSPGPNTSVEDSINHFCRPDKSIRSCCLQCNNRVGMLPQPYSQINPWHTT